MASNKAKDQGVVLQDILATLQRLEAHYADRNDRLSTIEFAMRAHTASSPVSCTGELPVLESWAPVARPDWQQQQSKQEEDTAEHQASLYKRSLMKLGNRFEFADDSCSDVGAIPQRPQRAAGPGADCVSMSVYSSRPLSVMDLLVSACETVVGPLDQDTACPVPRTTASSTGVSDGGTGDDRSSGVSKTNITAPSSIGGSSPPFSRRETARSARKMVVDRFKSSVRSEASCRSSQDYQPWDTDLQPRPKYQINTSFNERVVASRVGILSFVQGARVKARSCAMMLLRAAGSLGRFMIDQQLKRLDARV